MKRFSTDQLRNVALIGHGGAGKTSLAEAMLFDCGVIDRLGEVDAGTTTSDSGPDEIERRISIVASLLPQAWKDCKINLIDTPGYADFVGEVISGVRVADAVLLVIDAVAGVEVGAQQYWQLARDRGLPGMVFINKLEKENADFERVVEMVKSQLGPSVIISFPMGEATQFGGIVDLVKMKAMGSASESQPPPGEEIPAQLADQAAGHREKLVEAAAESDDQLTEKYLDEGDLTQEEVTRGLREATISGKVMPVLCGSALMNIGVHSLLDAVVAYLPSPADMPEVAGTDARSGQEVLLPAKTDEPTAALVFKTNTDPYAGKLSFLRGYSGTLHSDSSAYNSTRDSRERIGQLYVPQGKEQEAAPEVTAGDLAVVAKLQDTDTGDTVTDGQNRIILPGMEFPEPAISFSIHPKTRGDEDKVSGGLHRLAAEDPTLKVSVDEQTRETILSGMGDLHLEVAVDRLKRKFGVEVEVGTPKVAYRETILAKAQAQGKYKRQSGGRGQYGDVWLELEPLDRGESFEFVDKVVGGVVPRNYIPAVEKGVKEAAGRGVLAGYPVTGLRVTLYDGSHHSVDSSDLSFKIAGSMGFQNAAAQAKPVLQEPIMDLEVVVPEDNMGDVMGGLNSKRGRILGIEPQGNLQVVKAQVPLAEMFRYASELRSMTQGRGTYTMKFSHYEQVPDHIAEGIIAQAKQRQEEK